VRLQNQRSNKPAGQEECCLFIVDLTTGTEMAGLAETVGWVERSEPHH